MFDADGADRPGGEAEPVSRFSCNLAILFWSCQLYLLLSVLADRQGLTAVDEVAPRDPQGLPWLPDWFFAAAYVSMGIYAIALAVAVSSEAPRRERPAWLAFFAGLTVAVLSPLASGGDWLLWRFGPTAVAFALTAYAAYGLTRSRLRAHPGDAAVVGAVWLAGMGAVGALLSLQIFLVPGMV